MIVWAEIDLYDVFNTEETLLQIVQAAWLVDKNYKVKKTIVDNVLAALWLIPWGTQLIKWTKLAKYLENIDSKTCLNSKKWVAEKFKSSHIRELKLV
jgi:hypothetical protein